MDQQNIKKTSGIKRNIVLKGQQTSLALEDDFWRGLDEIAHNRNITVPALVEQIDRERDNDNLSSAIRVFVFNYFRHAKAGQLASCSA